MTTFEIIISVIGVILFVYLYFSARTSKKRYEELTKKFEVNPRVVNWVKDCYGGYYMKGYTEPKNHSTTNQKLFDNFVYMIDDLRREFNQTIDMKSNHWYNSVVGHQCDVTDCKTKLRILEPVIKYLELKKKIEADATTKENLKKELADLKKQVNDLLK